MPLDEFTTSIWVRCPHGQLLGCSSGTKWRHTCQLWIPQLFTSLRLAVLPLCSHCQLPAFHSVSTVLSHFIINHITLVGTWSHLFCEQCVSILLLKNNNKNKTIPQSLQYKWVMPGLACSSVGWVLVQHKQSSRFSPQYYTYKVWWCLSDILSQIETETGKWMQGNP